MCSIYGRGKTYSIQEVAALVEDFDQVKVMLDTNKRGLRWSAYHVDIDDAFLSLSKPLRGAVLLHGFCGYSLDASAKLAGVSRAGMYKRYVNGLERMTNYLNGVHG
jgi:DNA-directed RNA polymerase specialized sigma24 family protein